MSVSLIDGHIDDDVMTSEELIEELEKVRYNVTSEYHKAVIDAAIDTLQSQKAEIENKRDLIYRQSDVISEQRERIDRIYAEAIKEFAERLKEMCQQERFKVRVTSNFGVVAEEIMKVVDESDIDNLVKEMVGEASG